MMRIIAGRLRGRKLETLSGDATRPTSALVRGAAFNALGPGMVGGAFLDLFAGSGAMALEALSRGATRSVAVECAPAALRVLRANGDALAAGPEFQVVAADAVAALARVGGPFRAVFADPPYATDLALQALEAVAARAETLLEPGAAVLVETDPAHLPPEGVGPLALRKRYPHGGSVLSLYRYVATEP